MNVSQKLFKACICFCALLCGSGNGGEDPFGNRQEGNFNSRLNGDEVEDLYGEKYGDPDVGLIRANALALRVANEESWYQRKIKTKEQGEVRLTIVRPLGKSLILKLHPHNDKYYVAVKRLNTGSEKMMGRAHVELLGQVEISKERYLEPV